jgi:hypothetical protein
MDRLYLEAMAEWKVVEALGARQDMNTGKMPQSIVSIIFFQQFSTIFLDSAKEI